MYPTTGDVVVDAEFMFPIWQIVPGFLYLGDLDHAKADDRLDHLNITHVVTIHTEPVTLKKRFVQLFFNLAGKELTKYFLSKFMFLGLNSVEDMLVETQFCIGKLSGC